MNQNERMNPDETFTIKSFEKDGIKYHADVPSRYKDMELLFPIYRAGEMVFGSFNLNVMDGLKLDYPIKFQYQTLHNEKVMIPVKQLPKGTPRLIYEDELYNEEVPAFTEGITTKVENFNPEFTVQVKLSPNNWGTARKLMRLKGFEDIPVPKILSLEDWKKHYDSFEYFLPSLTDREVKMLTTLPTYELHAKLMETLQNATFNYWTSGFVQTLFNLPEIEYTHKPIYEEAPEDFQSSVPFKGVDIDFEVIGENYTYKGKIIDGSIIKGCNPIGKELPQGTKIAYYSFKFPIIPFIYDWFNVPMPTGEEIKKRRRFLRGDD